MPEEARAKRAEHLSNMYKGEGNPMYGKNAFANKSPEFMADMRKRKSDAMKGKNTGPKSEETRKKMSEAKKGKPPWNKGLKLKK